MPRCPASSRLALTMAVLATGGCVAKLTPPPPATFRPPPAEVDRSALNRALQAANGNPHRSDLQLAAGISLVKATVRGELEHRDRAEELLLAACRGSPTADSSCRVAKRVLGRFLNLRVSMLDFSKVDLQADLYATMVDETLAPEHMDQTQFALYCFLTTARTLETYRRGHRLAALRDLRAFERAIGRRLEVHPDDIDSFAMAGNFELTVAGMLPLGRHRRLSRAIEHMEVQHARWDELTASARNTELAPNVRTVFTFMVAEANLAAGRRDAAVGHYRRLIAFDDVAQTLPRRRIVEVSKLRLEALEHYTARSELLPVWPSGATGCVACHATSTDLPPDGLFTLDGRAPW